MRKCVFNFMFEHGVLCLNINLFMFEHKTPCSNIELYVQTYNSLFEQTVGTCGKCRFNSMFEHGVLCSNIKRFMFKHKTPCSNIKLKHIYACPLRGSIIICLDEETPYL